MTILIRPATQSDAPAIATVHVDSWRTSYEGIVPQEILSGLSHSERLALWDDILTEAPKSPVILNEAKRSEESKIVVQPTILISRSSLPPRVPIACRRGNVP